MGKKRPFRFLLSSGIGLAGAALLVTLVAAAAQMDIPGPPGSGEFGKSVVVLPNGNIVVTDPYYDATGPITDVGAVYLYDGATLVSQLTGSHANDQVGSGGVTVLANGNFVVASPYWNSVSAADAGAVTWGSGTTGVSGIVGFANSLVGSQPSDQVGSHGVTALNSGNYVIRSLNWDNGLAADTGAVTWGSGTTGVNGIINTINSLVGSHADDQVGSGGVTVLSNGNFVVVSPNWDNGGVMDAGAATWGSGAIGVSGVISVSNSLVGSRANDSVGKTGVTALNNGNYVVSSECWNNGGAPCAGAVTWGSGTTGITGAVTVSNSLVGSQPFDRVGNFGVTALSNGSFVVVSPWWNNGDVAYAGAVTWGSGTTGITGVVTVSNSLVGSQVIDFVGSEGVTALTNGNYVVPSIYWDNGGAADAGAVTWGSGTTGVTGTVTASNSLVGSQTDDQIGINGVTALSNGNYVVLSPYWDSGVVTDTGAATWGSGTTGITGVVTLSNSLVGSQAIDCVGLEMTALSNGNYVVVSYNWANGGVPGAGAATWGSGTTGITGAVTISNSLVGSQAYDCVGIFGVTALSNGSFVVASPWWHNGGVTTAGAATWGNGTTGVTGVVSASNSLVGSQANDYVGLVVTVLSNGNYVAVSPYWDNGGAADAGAATWGSGTTGVTGVVTVSNSLVGSQAGDMIGISGVTALSNGDYVVSSPCWASGAVTSTGAATWGDGTTGITGVVTVSNSLVGTQVSDLVGAGVTALANGNYVVRSPYWDNDGVADAGAVTLGDVSAGTTVGPVSAENSVLGTAASGGSSMGFDYDYARSRLVIGRPADHIVTLFPVYGVYLPLVMRGS